MYFFSALLSASIYCCNSLVGFFFGMWISIASQNLNHLVFNSNTKVSFNWLAIHVEASGVEVLKNHISQTREKNLQQLKAMHCVTDELTEKWAVSTGWKEFILHLIVLCLMMKSKEFQGNSIRTVRDERMKRKGCALFQNYLWLLSNKCETNVWLCEIDRENE